MQKLLVISLWLFLLSVSLHAQTPPVQHENAPQLPVRRPIALQDLLRSVELRTSIVQRVIKGADLSAALTYMPNGKPPVASTITLTDCVINGMVEAQNSPLANNIIANKCIFLGNIHLKSILQIESFWLRNSSLQGGLEITNCKLIQLDLDGSTLSASLSLSKVQVAGTLKLSRIQTTNTAAITMDTCSVHDTDWRGEEQRALCGVVQLSHCQFVKEVVFDNVHLFNLAMFDDCLFGGKFSFRAAHLGSAQTATGTPVSEGVCLFTNCQFAQTARFTGMTLGSGILGLEGCNFLGNCVMTDLQGNIGGTSANDLELPSRLGISSSSFAQRAYFDSVHVGQLCISTLPFSETNGLTVKDRIESPTTFARLVTFRRLECVSADFTETEFEGFVDFNRAQFKRRACFNNVTFNGEVSFSDVVFPPPVFPDKNPKGSHDNELPSGLWIDDAQFAKTARLSWRRLSESVPFWAVFAEPHSRLITTDPATWDTLQQVFKRSENLEGQNEAGYQKRKLSGQSGNTTLAASDDDSPAWNAAQRLFWGYGVRPARVFAWMLLLFTLCTFLHWLLSRRRHTQPSLNFDSQEIFRPQELAERWVMQSDPLSAFLWSSASASVQLQLLRYADPGFSMEELKAALIAVLNEKLLDPNMERFRYCHNKGSDIDARPSARKQRGYWMAACNRRFLLDSYREYLDSREGGNALLEALRFSWRTSFSINYGFKNAHTFVAKIVAGFQSVAFKILLFFWITSLSNTTPLLKDLVSKLIPT